MPKKITLPKVPPLIPPAAPLYFGVDLAPAKFDVCGPEGAAAVYPNELAQIRGFLKKLPAQAHLICESTGACHRLLVAEAHARGVAITVANPQQIREFARGIGRRAKTDPIDAGVLQCWGATVRPQADLAPRAVEAALRERVVARQQAVEARSALLLQFAQQSDPLARALSKARLAQLTRHIEKLTQAMARMIAEDETLAAKDARLQQVAGVGPTVAFTCLGLCPELGTLTRNEASALLGVAPYDRESGATSAPRRIAGGRYRLRHALYMAAVSSLRCNHVLGPYYQRLRAAGKPPKVALTAVMRKLFELLNYLLKTPAFQLATAPA